MNYNRIYTEIIENRLKNPITEGYTEKHHINPKSLGGLDNPDNLVKLSAREHFLCHYLLAKMYDTESFNWYKMNHAFMMMKCESKNNNRYFNSHLYESLKVNFSKVMSQNQQGMNNSQYGTCWVYNLEQDISRKIKKEDLIIFENNGWFRGRNLPKYSPLTNIIKIIKKNDTAKRKKREKEQKALNLKILNDLKLKNNIKFYEEEYLLYRKIGFKEYKKLKNYKYSFENFIMACKKYAPSYLSFDHKVVKQRRKN